jgi:hypothetical protein
MWIHPRYGVQVLHLTGLKILKPPKSYQESPLPLIKTIKYEVEKIQLQFLKGPSGQIRPAQEWYHWIGLYDRIGIFLAIGF